ncbi:unnamed protein product [Lactuca saligna]|uniref:Uncharacterized protein n=1 Tax=Lactuca saligna TaxID=75948 RepID=A0AA35YF27_LACSI|nr:unnamed protein product [Lactuca saligna]
MCNIEHVVLGVNVEEKGNGDSAHDNTTHAHVDTSSTSTEPQSSTQVELPDLEGREDEPEPEIPESEVRNTTNSPEVDPDPGYFEPILQDINEDEEAGSERRTPMNAGLSNILRVFIDTISHHRHRLYLLAIHLHLATTSYRLEVFYNMSGA